VSIERHDVSAALMIRDGCVLLCHRHPQRRWYPNAWDLPGGHIDAEEQPADALRRELLEELGVHVHLTSEEPWRVLTPSPDLTIHVWIVERWRGRLRNRAPHEHDAIGWFRPEQTSDLELVDDALTELISEATGTHRR
jgi:8-oxo-dGTP pyrophosphatase MutT (NUDIX family)